MAAVRSSRLVFLALTLTVLTGACAGSPKSSSAGGGVDDPALEAPVSAGDPSTTSTTALAAGSLVLAPDGLGPVRFGTQAARAMNLLTQALGRAETVERVGGADCGATRVFGWKTFRVLVNEASARSGSRPGLVGWLMDGADASLDLRTGQGIGIGSTVGALKAAYGEGLSIVDRRRGPTAEVTLPEGTLTGLVSGKDDRDEVRTLRAGVFCDTE